MRTVFVGERVKGRCLGKTGFHTVRPGSQVMESKGREDQGRDGNINGHPAAPAWPWESHVEKQKVTDKDAESREAGSGRRPLCWRVGLRSESQTELS